MTQKLRIAMKGAVLASVLIASSSLFADAKTLDLITRKNEKVNFTLINKEQLAVSGTVKDPEGMVLQGVTVSVPGTASRTATNASGNFTISVPSDGVLEFSMLGFLKQTVAVEGRINIDITLEDDSRALSEVVVTALGIKREEKALGYGVSVVQGKELTEAISSNWSDALKGKVAGLNLVQAGSGPVNSTRINQIGRAHV